MSRPLNVARALDLSLQHISQLIEMLDVHGYCQGTKTLKEARDFEEELLKFARYRKCCHTCSHYRPDDSVTRAGVPGKFVVCHGIPGYEPRGRILYGDPGANGMHCIHYDCKYEGGDNG